MANIVQFVVDDTSPSISYLPFGDTLSLPDRSAGWNPFFSESGFADAQGVTGNGTSLHVTSHDGAQLIVSWQGTTVQLQGNVTDASYSVELDGEVVTDLQAIPSQNVLATFQGLNNVQHTVSITARIPSDQRTESSLVVFDQAIIASTPPSLEPSTSDNVYVSSPLNSQSIAFNGRWSFVSEGSTNRHLSQSPGDRATIRFRGTAFLLRGTTSPSSGWYSVTLNNQTTTFSARSSFLAHDSLLYYATALEPNATHTITIANEGEGQLALSENGFRAFAVGSPDPDPAAGPPAIVQASSSLPKATIAALALGAVLGCLFLCVMVYVFCVCLPRRRREKERMSWGQNVARSRHSYTEPRHSKVGEAYPSIIDIAQPERRQPTDIDIEPQYGESPPRNGRKSDSGISRFTGFLRWKKEVETSVARRSLGIDFAHSPEENGQAQMHEKTLPARQHSTDETESSPQSTNRSLSSIAFRASRMVRKPFERWGKTYTAATSSSANDNPQERSWSPSYQINLPFQPPLVRAQDTNADLGSEFYPAPPPSYAASVMSNVGNSTRIPSLPRSVGQESSVPVNSASASPESRRQGGGLLAVPRPSYGGSDADIDVNTPPLALRGFSQEDRGSVHEHESGDEDPRVLGTNSERYVLRSLSPRTSRATPSLSVPPPKRKKAPEEPREAQANIANQPPSSFPPAVPSPTTQARLSLAQVQHQTRPLPPVPSRPSSLQKSAEQPSIASLDQRQDRLVAGPESTVRPLPIPDAPSPSSPVNAAPSSPPPTIITSAPSPIRAATGRHSNSPLAPRGGRPPPVSMLRRQPSGANPTHPRVSLLRFAPDVEQRRAFRLTPPVSFIPFPVQRRPFDRHEFGTRSPQSVFLYRFYVVV
ncbi:hypothetical protein BKA70DRAFT_406931 [Coprinopsis sp. MPI-PUGE-AT-0042]|nr:hypothetical protein BKA70DRAFT_406931 [Coprinopsis sp. MPI-PUGE-AT-0042]